MADGSSLLSPDWKAVVTNAVAFVAAVLVLRRLAWKRIMDFLEARRSRIEGGFREIADGRASLEAREAEYSARMEAIESEARALKQREVEDGRRLADRMLDSARSDMEAMREDARQTIEISKQMAEAALRRDMVEMSLTAAEKLVRSGMDDRRHREFVEQALEDLSKERPFDR